MSKLTATEVRVLLRAHFDRAAYAVLEEVSDDAGFDRSRSADMIVQGLWPSRGLLLEGIEIKVSRADWINELRDPAKAEVFVRWCDRWWVATADPAIIQPGELPETWGHMSVVGGRIKVITPAPKLEAQPMERGFLAAMLKRAQKLPDVLVKEQVDAKLEDAVRCRISHYQRNAEKAKENLEELRQMVRAYEQGTGNHVGYPNTQDSPFALALKRLSAIKIPGGKDLEEKLGGMEAALTQTLFGIRRIKEAYGPALAQFEEQSLVELPPSVPLSLVATERFGGTFSPNPVASGHVFSLSLYVLKQEKTKTSRGFIRIWEPPLVGSTRTRGTKRRPSTRYVSDVIPCYNLRARHASLVEEMIELVYTETPSASPSWDIIALLPDGWTPKLEDAQDLGLVVEVDDRPHRMWAIPTTPEVPLEHLGAWVMSGEIPAESAAVE